MQTKIYRGKKKRLVLQQVWTFMFHFSFNKTSVVIEKLKSVEHWLFELSQRCRDANIVAQEVQRGYEVAPLDQLSQRAAAEGVFCYLEARLLGEQAQVN